MSPAKMPRFLARLFPKRLWFVPTREKTLYLTFDDGPIPEVTPFVLDTLAEHGAQATFFCVGENVHKHPEVYRRILEEGHAVGNHTFHHLNGWKTPTEAYLDNVARCAELVESPLFRPPYGRLTQAQAKRLNPTYRLVMWDVLAKDYDPTTDAEACFQNVSRHARPGSIVVLHDSLKAQHNLRVVLPRILAFFGEKGFSFQKLPA